MIEPERGLRYSRPGRHTGRARWRAGRAAETGRCPHAGLTAQTGRSDRAGGSERREAGGARCLIKLKTKHKCQQKTSLRNTMFGLSELQRVAF